MKIGEVFKDIIAEEKSSKDKKIFYRIDINIAGDNERFIAKGGGVVNVPEDDATSLITVEDVITYLVQEEARSVIKSSGDISKKDLLKEILVAFMDENVNVAEYATRTDKILFSFDYGNEIEDSAGVLVNKIENSSSFSVVMRYGGNVQNAKFKRDTIDKQIQFFSRLSK
jgi:hypothetical protein